MGELKQSVPDWPFFGKSGLSPDEYYRRLKTIGFDTVEMVPPERRNAAHAAGLDILNLAGPGICEGLNRVENHAVLLPGISAAIAEARAARIPHVIVFSGNIAGQDTEEGLSNCVAALKELAPEAENSGVTLVFEMLNAYDHPDYQADHSSYGFRLVRAVDSHALRILFDIYHMHRMDEDVCTVMESNLDLIAHIHVAGSPARDFPGADQDIDYAGIVARINDAGYNGFWGQEWMPSGDDPLDELDEARDLFDSCVIE